MLLERAGRDLPRGAILRGGGPTPRLPQRPAPLLVRANPAGEPMAYFAATTRGQVAVSEEGHRGDPVPMTPWTPDVTESLTVLSVRHGLMVSFGFWLWLLTGRFLGVPRVADRARDSSVPGAKLTRYDPCVTRSDL